VQESQLKRYASASRAAAADLLHKRAGAGYASGDGEWAGKPVAQVVEVLAQVSLENQRTTFENDVRITPLTWMAYRYRRDGGAADGSRHDPD